MKAIKVKLREKAISGGRKSLYLDFYPPIVNQVTGELTRREFLGLYIVDNAKNALDKVQNKNVLQRAEQIRQIRENNLNKPEIYHEFEKAQLRLKELGEADFVAYFKKLADKRASSNHDNWMSAYNYLTAYAGEHLPFSKVDEPFCEGFKEYLLTTKSVRSDKVKLAQNSAQSYFNKFKATLKQAFKDGFLPNNLNEKIAQIKTKETHRNFLTIEELNILVQKDCPNQLLKRAALFSALTGLRFSDIKKLKWDEVQVRDGNHYLHFEQQKTEGVEVLPISEQAASFMGNRGESKQEVFEGLTYSAYSNKHLYQWIGAAGITRDITFHCFRHTYATLQLTAGTDLYTVSKMLGHRDIKTTQIYAKIVDQKKQDATDKIKLDL